MTTPERVNSPRQQPIPNSLSEEGVAGAEMSLEAKLTRRHFELAAEKIPQTLHHLLHSVRHLGTLPFLANAWQEHSDEIARFYKQLKVTFDRAAEVLPQLRSEASSLRRVVLHDHIEKLGSEMYRLTNWAEEIGETLLGGLLHAPVARVAAEPSADEVDSEEKGSDDGEHGVIDLRTVVEAYRKQHQATSANLRARIALFTRESEDDPLYTVADFMSGFSNPIVYLQRSAMSVGLEGGRESVAPIVATVLDRIFQFRDELVALPPVSPSELADLVSGRIEGHPEGKRLEQTWELLATHLPVVASVREDGSIRISLSWPERGWDIWQSHLTRLVEDLKGLRDSGIKLEITTKVVESSFEFACILQLPNAQGIPRPIRPDTDVVMEIDGTALERIAEEDEDETFILKVRRDAETPELSVKTSFMAVGNEERRMRVGKILPKLCELAWTVGGTSIEIVLEEQDSEDAQADLCVEISKEVARETSHNTPPSDDDLQFQADHRYLRRWQRLGRLADEFSEEPVFVSPYLKLSGCQVENSKLMQTVQAIHSRARLMYLDLSGVRTSEAMHTKLMTRVKAKLEHLLKDVPPEEPVEVSIGLRLAQSTQAHMIEIICTDAQQNLYACARLGLMADTGEERILPHTQMAYFAASIRTALRELWESKKLTGAALQTCLAERGCEIDSSLALSLERHQLRRATLMTSREVQGFIIHAAMDDSNEYVIRTDVEPYTISFLSRINHDHLYGESAAGN